jgi:hypothetical protein
MVRREVSASDPTLVVVKGGVSDDRIAVQGTNTRSNSNRKVSFANQHASRVFHAAFHDKSPIDSYLAEVDDQLPLVLAGHR